MEKVIFSERERLFLVQLVSDEKDIIENKRTDGTTIKLKTDAWERIRTLFNSQGLSNRSTKQLKKCWENIKQRKRKLNTTIRQDYLMKVVDPMVKVIDDPVMDFVDAAAPNLDVEVPYPWDSTAGYKMKGINTDITEDTASVSDTNPVDVLDINLIPVTPLSKKRKLTNELQDGLDEHSLRSKKIKESIMQQRELHNVRMKTAKIEQLLAILKVRQQLQEMGEDLDVENIDFDNFNPKDLL